MNASLAPLNSFVLQGDAPWALTRHGDDGPETEHVAPRRAALPSGWGEVRGLTNDGVSLAHWLPTDHPSAAGLLLAVADCRERMAARRALAALIDTSRADAREIARLRAAATVPTHPSLSHERPHL